LGRAPAPGSSTTSQPDANAPAPGSLRAYWRLVGYVRPYLGVLALAVALSAVYAGSRTARAWLLEPVFDEVILPHQQSGERFSWQELRKSVLGGDEQEAPEPEPDSAEQRESVRTRVTEALPRILFGALAIVLVLPLAHVGQEVLSQWVLGRVLLDLQQQLCEKLLALPLRFHHGQARGETLSRVMNDAQKAHQSLDLLFQDVVQSTVGLLVGAAVLVFISWQLTLALLVIAPLLALVIAAFGRRIRSSARRRQESQSDVTQRLLQILSGIKVIQAFRAQRGEAEAFARENQRYFRRNLRVQRTRAYSRSAVEGMNNLNGVLILFGGVALILGELWGLSFGALAAFVAVMQTTYAPLRDLTRGWTKLQEAVPSAERFFEILDEAPETPDAAGAVRLDGIRHGIRVDKVSFSYGREPVLRDISFETRKGEMVAIVGATGSGKTTLADLLLRFYDPDAGAIEVDGVDLRRIARDSWLEHVAVVTQDPFLFAGTIRENIVYGRPGASEAELREAARVAHVDEFLGRLPNGWDTDVGEAGTLLSGGQRQRITIARAVLKNPEVLIFDEATSALDAKSERLVQEAVDGLLAGRTTFVIAHRLSTVRHADKILVLERGTVAEHGTHEELLAKGGRYAELMSHQSEGRF
jgi:ATP-binding cassette, subfamily B, bacterial MsbA